MKKILIFLFSLIVGSIIFGLVMDKIGWKSLVLTLSTFNGLGGFVVILLTFLMALVGILRWHFILKTQGYNLSFWGLTQIWIAGFAISYVTPVALYGGEVFRSYSLKKKYDIPWHKNIASIVVETLLEATFLLQFLVFGLLSFFVLFGFPPQKIGLLIGMTILVLFIVLSFFYFKSYKGESMIKGILGLVGIKKLKKGVLLLDVEKEVFRFFRPGKKYIWQGLSLSFLRYFLSFLRCWFLIYFLGGGLNILKSAAILSSVKLSYAIPIPAALGSLEAIQTAIFPLLGLKARMGTAFSLLFRSADMIICVLGIAFLIKLSFNIIKINIIGRIDSLKKKIY